MIDILEKIVAQKRIEIEQRKGENPLHILTTRPAFKESPNSLVRALTRETSSGIISEFKRKSPSLGWISQYADAETVTRGYVSAGAAGISCLTDFPFFGGTVDDFRRVRRANYNTPILRKDFIVDEYQLFEAKAWGADVILLIAECLTKQQVAHLANIAHDLGLEVLLEMHSESELEKINDHINMVGINNRDLKTFRVSIQTSIDLAPKIPNQFVKIAESGISQPQTLPQLRAVGYKGFLIGEAFMKTADPAQSLQQFIADSKNA
jgi:indole-3-glycerol phosphate synthase